MTRATSRWKWQFAITIVVLFVVIVGTLVWLFSRPSADLPSANLPSSHPVFGAIHETSAIDVMELPEIRGPTGLLPRNPVYLVVGSGLLEWSTADVRARKPSRYLYFWDPVSAMKGSDVWGGCSLPAIPPCGFERGGLEGGILRNERE